MSRKSVKMMIYNYFLNLISPINTYISIIYTESTVRNVIPQGNHNKLHITLQYRNTVRNVIPQGNHNNFSQFTPFILLLETLYRKVITTRGNYK